MESSSNSNSNRIKKEIKEDPPHYNLVEIGSVKLETSSNGTQSQQRQQRGNNHNQSTTTQTAQFQQQQQSSAAYFQPQQQQNGLHPSMGNANNGAFNGSAGANANNNSHQMLGGPEAMQAFANLGLFGHQQFPGGIMPAAPACVPPHLAAAAAAAAYGQRLIGGPGQNGCSAAQLVRRNLTPGHGPPSCSAPPIHSTSSSTSSSSINRSQRCGVCRGCQCKPCGLCTYCQDSPQFGGPGVKKQSCIERRCLRVLENRLQRDAPTFKARIGCNSCEDCRSPDCQICLVCLDRRFFNCKYMAGALCAKKRCNNATALELPCSAERMSLKRPSADGGGGGGPSPHHHQNSQQMAAKRQVLAGIPQQSDAGNIAHSHNVVAQHQLNSNIARILSAASGGDSIGQQQKFGRSSNNSNSTNSPLSECGGGGAGGLPPPSQSTSPPSALQMPSAAMSSVAQLGRPPFCWGASPTQMLGHQYPFDQMASLAAAAAVGFPQHQVMAANYPNPYQPKFLNYPKYEYFTSEDGPQIATMANGGLPIEHHHHSNGISGADGQQIGNGGNGQGEGGGGGGGTVTDNLLVPPSYSDVQKVVLQPL